MLSAFKHLCPTFKTILVHILISWIKRQATLILKIEDAEISVDMSTFDKVENRLKPNFFGGNIGR